MSNLFVGSVFAPSSRNETWSKLQLEWLEKTSCEYKHFVFLNGNVDPSLFSESVVVGRGNGSHARGLNHLLRKAADLRYDACLLLDSDCFPIQKGWQSLLREAMGKYLVAAPVRYENLDTFAHPCAFFVRGKAIGKIRFANKQGVNLLGEKFIDCQANVSSFFPLVRTNTINLHPLMFGVYWDCFYHHGAGSRVKEFRLDCYYPKKKLVNDEWENILYRKLSKNSEEFIAQLLANQGSFKGYI